MQVTCLHAAVPELCPLEVRHVAASMRERVCETPPETNHSGDDDISEGRSDNSGSGGEGVRVFVCVRHFVELRRDVGPLGGREEGAAEARKCKEDAGQQRQQLWLLMLFSCTLVHKSWCATPDVLSLSSGGERDECSLWGRCVAGVASRRVTSPLATRRGASVSSARSISARHIVLSGAVYSRAGHGPAVLVASTRDVTAAATRAAGKNIRHPSARPLLRQLL